MFKTLDEFQAAYRDHHEFHRKVHESFCEDVNRDWRLREHRDYVEKNAYGMGERSFHRLYDLILKDLDAKTPDNHLTLRALEIGVHRGQLVSLMAILAQRLSRPLEITGASLFDGTEVGEKRDYRDDVETILSEFTGVKFDPEFKKRGARFAIDGKFSINMIRGDSTHPSTIETVAMGSPYHLVVVDGGHSFDCATMDIKNYAQMLHVGGILAIDDCCNNLEKTHEVGGRSYPLWLGAFCGIQSVSDAVDALLPPKTPNESFQPIGSVVHHRLWRRVR